MTEQSRQLPNQGQPLTPGEGEVNLIVGVQVKLPNTEAGPSGPVLPAAPLESGDQTGAGQKTPATFATTEEVRKEHDGRVDADRRLRKEINGPRQQAESARNATKIIAGEVREIAGDVRLNKANIDAAALLTTKAAEDSLMWTRQSAGRAEKAGNSADESDASAKRSEQSADSARKSAAQAEAAALLAKTTNEGKQVPQGPAGIVDASEVEAVRDEITKVAKGVKFDKALTETAKSGAEQSSIEASMWTRQSRKHAGKAGKSANESKTWAKRSKQTAIQTENAQNASGKHVSNSQSFADKARNSAKAAHIARTGAEKVVQGIKGIKTDLINEIGGKKEEIVKEAVNKAKEATAGSIAEIKKTAEQVTQDGKTAQEAKTEAEKAAGKAQAEREATDQTKKDINDKAREAAKDIAQGLKNVTDQVHQADLIKGTIVTAQADVNQKTGEVQRLSGEISVHARNIETHRNDTIDAAGQAKTALTGAQAAETNAKASETKAEKAAVRAEKGRLITRILAIGGATLATIAIIMTVLHERNDQDDPSAPQIIYPEFPENIIVNIDEMEINVLSNDNK